MALPIPSMSRLAKEISEGYITLSPVMLKNVPVSILTKFHRELLKMLQSVRGLSIDSENFKEIKEKNMKISRVNHAMQILKYFCKERRIHL